MIMKKKVENRLLNPNEFKFSEKSFGIAMSDSEEFVKNEYDAEKVIRTNFCLKLDS